MKELTVATSADDSTASENDAPNGGADAPSGSADSPDASSRQNEHSHNEHSDGAESDTPGGTPGGTRRYEDAVLRIVHESLQRFGPRGEAASRLLDRAAARAPGTAAPLLAEVRRRMREERGLLRGILRGERREERARRRSAWERRADRPPRWTAAKERVARIRSLPATVRRRIRKRLTGDQDKRVREHLRDLLEEPPAVRTRDKFSFMLGVLGCGVIEFVILRCPERFPLLYASFIIPLLLLRLYLYASLNWHFFLIDFCYFSNVLCLVQVLWYPASVPLIVLNFAHTAGPLAVAIPAWRNSLVFHSLDKVTSVFVHGLPPLLLFASRWYPAADTEIPDSIGTAYTMGLSLLGYFGWQLFYLVQTEVFGRRALASNDKMMTSIRWLTTPDKGGGYSGMAAGAMAAARSCGFFAPGEPFDSEHWKTKVVFMLVQLIYTAVTLLPIPWLWQSFELHLAYLLCIYTVCVWNGGSYYIEVFSKAYRKQFEGDRDQRRRAVFESFGAPEGERPKRTPSVGDVAAAGSGPAPDPLSAIPLASPHDRDSLPPPPPDDGAAADGGARLKAE